MLKTYFFELHASAISGPFAEVFTFGTSLEDVKISGDITSRMCSIRISKTSPFSASDLRLAINKNKT